MRGDYGPLGEMVMTKKELAERLAEIALSHCAHDSDPEIDEESAYDKRVLVRKFLEELNSHARKEKK